MINAAADQDESAVAQLPAVDRMVIHWYGPVEKVGRQLGAHSRVVFVTDSCVYVCLPSGGVTRTLELGGVHLAYAAPGAVSQVFEKDKPSLVLRHETDELRDDFLACVDRVRRTLCDGVGVDIQTTATYTFELDSGAPRSTSPSSSVGLAKHRLVPPAIAQRADAHTPPPTRPTISEGQQTSSVTRSASATHDIAAPEEQRLHTSPGQPTATNVSPLAKWSASLLLAEGSTAVGNAVGVATAEVGQRPRKSASPPAATASPGVASSRERSPGHGTPEDFKVRHDAREQQLSDLRHAVETRTDVVDTRALQQLQKSVEQQQHVIDEMKRDVATTHVAELRRDLDHSHALIADLQVALRSQESTFAELMRAQEAQRASQAVQSSLETELRVVKEERDQLRSEASAWRAEVDRLREEARATQRRHDAELDNVREAFVTYDANVAAYIEEIRRDSTGCAPQHPHAPRQPRDAPKSSEPEAVVPEQLKTALMKHLNTYANARFQLPLDSPPPRDAIERSATLRDRTIL